MNNFWFTYENVTSEVLNGFYWSSLFQRHSPGHFAPETDWGMGALLWAVIVQPMIDFLVKPITSKESPSRVDSIHHKTLTQLMSCWEGSHPWKWLFLLLLLLVKNILLVDFSSKKRPLCGHPCHRQHHKYLEFCKGWVVYSPLLTEGNSLSILVSVGKMKMTVLSISALASAQQIFGRP